MSAGRIFGAEQALPEPKSNIAGLEQFKHAARYQRRKFCAFTTNADGLMASASKRSRTAGSKLVRPVACRRSRWQRCTFSSGDHIGRAHARAAPRESRSSLCARPPWQRGRVRQVPRERRLAGNSRPLRRCANPRGRAQAPAMPVSIGSICTGRIVGDRLPCIKIIRQSARSRALSARTGRDDRGWRRRENCARPRAAVHRCGLQAENSYTATRALLIEPLVSEPSASGTMPLATAAVSRRRSRRSCARGSCGLREAPVVHVLAV